MKKYLKLIRGAAQEPLVRGGGASSLLAHILFFNFIFCLELFGDSKIYFQILKF